jgi:hypothetical protein
MTKQIKVHAMCAFGEEVSESAFDEWELKNSIRLVIAGYLYEDGDILRVPSLLHEMYEDYRNEIKKQM